MDVYSRCLAHSVPLGCISEVACSSGVSGPHCHGDLFNYQRSTIEKLRGDSLDEGSSR